MPLQVQHLSNKASKHCSQSKSFITHSASCTRQLSSSQPPPPPALSPPHTQPQSSKASAIHSPHNNLHSNSAPLPSSQWCSSHSHHLPSPWHARACHTTSPVTHICDAADAAAQPCHPLNSNNRPQHLGHTHLNHPGTPHPFRHQPHTRPPTIYHHSTWINHYQPPSNLHPPPPFQHPSSNGAVRPFRTAHMHQHPHNPWLVAAQAHALTQPCNRHEHVHQPQHVHHGHMSHGRMSVRVHASGVSPGAPGLDPERLVALLERMADEQQVPEPEWCDLLYAATTTRASQLNASQRASLLTGLVQLGVQPPSDWVELMLQVDVPSCHALDLMQLWISSKQLGYTPSHTWVWSVMTQVAAHVSDLDAVQAAVAITIPVDLNVVLEGGPGARGDQQGEEPGVKQEEMASWLDIMLRRVVEDHSSTVANTSLLSDEEEEIVSMIPPEVVVAVAKALTQVYRHIGPDEWLDFLSVASLRSDLGPNGCAHVAVALAAARKLPDLILAPQMYIMTADYLDVLEPSLVCDMVWAVASWHVCKEGGPMGRFDLRPQGSWWDLWFQATGTFLRDHILARQVLVRLIWSLAILRVRPPKDWVVLLVKEVAGVIMASGCTPLELLYLTRASDMWYGMLAGVDTLPPRSGAQGKGPAAPVSGRLSQIVGVPVAYEPPIELPALVKDCLELMTSSPLPPGWRRINTRYPPYSLPARADEEVPQEGEEGEVFQGDKGSQGGEGQGIGMEKWSESEAARRIYGPLSPPSW